MTRRSHAHIDWTACKVRHRSALIRRVRFRQFPSHAFDFYYAALDGRRGQITINYNIDLLAVKRARFAVWRGMPGAYMCGMRERQKRFSALEFMLTVGNGAVSHCMQHLDALLTWLTCEDAFITFFLSLVKSMYCKNTFPPSPFNGGPKYNARKIFGIKDARRGVLEQFGHKNRHLYELTLSCNFGTSSKLMCVPHCENIK